MIQCGLKTVRVYERDEVANLLFFALDPEGKTATFEIRKVEKTDA